MNEHTNIPQHVAVIMDGNGRWAKAMGRPRVYGHTVGAQRIRDIVRTASNTGVKVLTLYAFSTENWKRPTDEVGFLMQLLYKFLESEVSKLCENNVRLSIIGDVSVFSPEIREKIHSAVQKTKDNTGLILNIALNYGARAEITRAMNCLHKEKAPNDVITENDITQHLYTASLPDPDLLIRTAGEMRISNFLLWQAAYSEFVFVPVCWPDFTEKEFHTALDEYARRKRTYGGLDS